MDEKKRVEYFKQNIINTSENYIEYLDFLSRGNIYVLPPEAQIDVYSQEKDVSVLNTITGWSKAGYGVKNGKDPIFIKNNEREMYLFDINQTGIRDKKRVTQNLTWTGETLKEAGIYDFSSFFFEGKDAAFIETEKNINKIFEEFSLQKKSHWKEFAFFSLKYIIGERLGESNKREMQAAKSRIKGLFYLDNPILMPEYAYEVIEELSKTITKEFRKASEYIENTSKISKQEEETFFAEQVDKSLNGTLSPYTTLKVCDTPQSLLDVGCEQLPMLYTQRHLKNAINPDSKKEHFHGLSVEQIKKLPNLLKNPVMIYDSLSRNDSIVAVTSEFDKNNNPIIVSIKPNGEGRYELETIEANFITSVHGRENFINQIKNVIKQDKMLFCDKKKSQEMFDRWGLQLSELTNILSFDIIIHQSRNIINPKTQEISDKSAEDLKGKPDKQAETVQEEKTDATDTLKSEEHFPMPKFNTEPIVTILWSEHSRLHDGESMSFSEANALIENLDRDTVSEDGYYKTKFRIDFVMNGKPDNYTGRQDLGDGDGTLIDHIENYHTYYENNEEWGKFVLRNKGKEAMEEDKAQREMLLYEFVPYLKLHNKLSNMEQTATKALQENEKMTSEETAYYTAMKEYVSECRVMVNSGNYELPPVPQLKDFDMTLVSYKEHVREEISKEAAAVGMTVEEYAANGYEPYAAKKAEYMKKQMDENETAKPHMLQEGNKQVSPIEEESLILPTITCEWSESSIFENGKIYSVYEFDRLMKVADDKQIAGRNAAILKYGSEEKWMEEEEYNEFTQFLGYKKTKFNINMPDGSIYTERQDIGDGDGGVIDFLRKDPEYSNIIPILEKARDIQKAEIESENSERETEYTENKNDENPRAEGLETEDKISTQKIISVTGDKSRYQANVSAIRTLKQLETEKRLPSTEYERETLKNYQGWGGCQDAFDVRKEKWSKEYEELKGMLDDKEYTSARASVNTAFYTSPRVIESIYTILRNMGFTGGRILDPAMGTGRFYQYMPEDIKSRSELYGVEIDGVSGRIAKMLNPDAHIDIMGYENTAYQDGSFDLVVGNIPFGDINIDKYKIHDYFIIKSLDMLRDGGIMALITSKGTMDKRYSKVREDIDAQAQLAAAIRLPRGTFGDTDVTSDILFFVKRRKAESIVSEWAEVANDENGIPINRYFINNPDMILGKMRYSSIYGGDSVTECVTEDSRDSIINKLEKLSSEINTGYKYIKSTDKLPDVIRKETYNDGIDFDSINAEYDIKPYTYTIYNDILYFREENRLIPYKTYIETTGERKYSEKKEHIVRDMCEIKIILISLIDAMKRNCTDDELNVLQKKLNEKYDVFVGKYGSINKNISIYGDDVQNSLLASIEKKTIKVENGKELSEYSKEAVFNTRTIQYTEDTEKYDNFTDALTGSINVFDRVDMEYISGHTGRTKEEATEELLKSGEIFLNPDKLYRGYEYYEALEIREVYLSGNVRKKLETAEKYFENNNDKYGTLNINELKKVLPEWITHGDIKISIGSNIIRPEDYEKFIEEILELGSWEKSSFRVEYEQVTSSYYLNKKNFYGFNNREKYGTKRITAAEIFENLLNNRSVEVKDAHINPDGSKKYVVNEEETILAKSKAEDIIREWENWLFKDEERIQYYEEKYNKIFNSEIIPEYSGDKLTIPFMTSDITLRSHQKSAITRAIRGNLLLAHPVGAGKTFVMAGAAMKLKSIGAASKPLIVVPNSLVGQIAADFMKMFPSANILATSEKDFQTKNRKRFISKIAVGNYDAIIMGHSQFGLIGISPQRQMDELNQSVRRIENLVMNTHESDHFTIKQLEKTKKSYQDKISKLMNAEKKDMEIYFEDLGVDALMIDEAHEYKNLEVLTKMSRMAGVQTASSQKSYDLYMKCKYIREIKGERNILFSTGTPLSNTICEMYTWQRYLSEEKLAEKNINNFDDWVSLFGKIENVWEVAPEGDKFQSRRKISKFRNIPELKKMFLSFADVRQRNELSLPVPALSNDKYNIIEVEPCVMQKEGQKDIIQRANELRKGGIDPKKDNMLKVCSDARKLAIDPRLCMNGEDYQLLSDDVGITKLDVCVSNVYDIYRETENFRGTQVIFSDIGTPNSDKAFNVYDYLKKELVLKGIPKEEICFIHDAQNNKQKLEQMHEDMRTGRKRIIIGSTSKLGTGTNIQTLLVAEHDLDVPWRPSDVEQREGRIIRQGNTNKEVRIFRYVTKGSFDSYNWNTVENKARFISQIMNSRDINTREHEDISDEVMKFAEMVAAASGNPLFTERLQVENELRKLEVIKRNFDEGKSNIKNLIEIKYPEEISQITEKVRCMTEDEKLKNVSYENFEIVIMDKTYDDRVTAGAAIMACVKDTEKQYFEQKIGKYRGFELYCRTSLSPLTGGAERNLYIIGASGLKYTAEVTDATDKGICMRIDNRINKITLNKDTMLQKLEEVKTSYEAAKEEYKTEFAEEERMNYLINRRKEIELELTKMSDEPEHVPVKGGSR